MKKKILKVTSALCAVIGVLLMTAGNVFASDFYGITGEAPASNDIFHGATEVVTDVGNSAINMLTVCGAIAMVLALIILGIGLMIFKGASDVSNGKKHVLVIICASIFVFGAVSFGTGLSKVGKEIGDSINTETIGGTQGNSQNGTEQNR